MLKRIILRRKTSYKSPTSSGKLGSELPGVRFARAGFTAVPVKDVSVGTVNCAADGRTNLGRCQGVDMTHCHESNTQTLVSYSPTNLSITVQHPTHFSATVQHTCQLQSNTQHTCQLQSKTLVTYSPTPNTLVSCSPKHLSVTVQHTCQSQSNTCLLYTSPSPRDASKSRMPSSA